MRVPPDTDVHAEKLPDSKPSAKMLSIDGVAVLVEVGDGVGVLVGEGVIVGDDVAVKVGEGVGVLVGRGVGVTVEVGTAPLAIKLYAAKTSMRPVPNVLSGPAVPRSRAEAVIAFRRSATVKVGNALRSNAIAPETCGAANDVPVAE